MQMLLSFTDYALKDYVYICTDCPCYFVTREVHSCSI